MMTIPIKFHTDWAKPIPILELDLELARKSNSGAELTAALVIHFLESIHSRVMCANFEIASVIFNSMEGNSESVKCNSDSNSNDDNSNSIPYGLGQANSNSGIGLGISKKIQFRSGIDCGSGDSFLRIHTFSCDVCEL